MIHTPGWRELGRAVSRVTPAGPTVSPSAAAASAARLRRALRWSAPLLPDLSGLPEATARGLEAPSLVVDRRGAIEVCADLAAGFVEVGESRGGGDRDSAPRVRPGVLHLTGASAGLRALAPHVKGLWDPFRRRRILVAPNVLATAEKGALDQTDYSRWVALRSGLWGTLFEQAPWMVDFMSRTTRHLPQSTGDFARLVLLLDAVVTSCLEDLGPQDIPSVGWIRHNAPEPAGVSGLRVLSWLGIPVVELDPERAHAEAFARTVRDHCALSTLLTSPDYLPTREEFEHPQSWVRRVGA
ncbi:MAG: zinc-dependent metalloprotease [Actinomyces sp.]|nr:zinc-dependent metalloprotease [Actinomyces sp.]